MQARRPQQIKNPPAFAAGFRGCFSARVGIRTPNLLIRSQMLYPIELRMPDLFKIYIKNVFLKRVAKIRRISLKVKKISEKVIAEIFFMLESI